MQNIPNYLKTDIDITEFSNFRTKAKAKYYFELNSIEDLNKLIELWRFCEDNKIQLLIMWRWTNTIFAFNKFEWVFIKNNLNGWSYNDETKILEAYSNELISLVALKLKKEFNNDIWERFIWLPWSVWAAVFWNAWCFWLEAESNFLEAEVLNLQTWQIEIFDKTDSKFAYRTSIFKENASKYFIIKAKFDVSKVIEKYSSDIDAMRFRMREHPAGYTCWSFFKNPSREHAAWALIEEVGLKWYKIWGAFFSEKHANFLMSDWIATYEDLLELVDLTIAKVKQEKWIELIPEVRIIKNN